MSNSPSSASTDNSTSSWPSIISFSKKSPSLALSNNKLPLPTVEALFSTCCKNQSLVFSSNIIFVSFISMSLVGSGYLYSGNSRKQFLSIMIAGIVGILLDDYRMNKKCVELSNYQYNELCKLEEKYNKNINTIGYYHNKWPSEEQLKWDNIIESRNLPSNRVVLKSINSRNSSNTDIINEKNDNGSKKL